MHENDRRPEHLGWIETALRATHPDLPGLRVSGQSHYRQSNRIAFVDVFGIDGDHIRRRQIRAEASDMLRQLGYAVEIEPGCDVYDLTPIRPVSAHDSLWMLRHLRNAYDQGG